MKESTGRYTGGFARLKLVLRHARHGFSLILAPHGTGTTVTFNLPGRMATGILVVIVVFVAGIAFMGITYAKLATLALETRRLETENESLRMQNERIAEVERELVRIDKVRRQIEAWAGIATDEALVLDEDVAGGLDPNAWPRKYTYAIMKPFYVERLKYRHGMIAPAAGWISRGFTGDSGTEPAHLGIDIAASAGSPVRCALGGRVRSAGWDDIYGNLIVVDHSDSLSTIYGHNEKILVKEGDYVNRGQVIATIGSTGRSTAPHLHFAVLKNQMPVDPERYVRFSRD